MLLFLSVAFAMTFSAGVKSSASGDDIAKMITVNSAQDKTSSKYRSYEEFVEFKKEHYPKIVFASKIELRNFEFIELEVDDSEMDRKMRVKGALYSLDKLLPEKPFVVTWEEGYDPPYPPHRGISFVDRNNTKRYFAIGQNDEGGSPPPLLIEFQPGAGGKFSLDDEISRIITVHDTEEDCSLAKPPEWKCPPSKILDKYSSFEEFVEFKEVAHSHKIVLVPKIELKNFKYIELDDEEDKPWERRRIKSVLYSLDKLLPGKPFVVTWWEPTDFPDKGISFVDGNNVTRYFDIHDSNKDGGLYISEFQPVAGGKLSPASETKKIPVNAAYAAYVDIDSAAPELLSKYRPFEEFVEKDAKSKKDDGQKIIFMPKTELRNFRFIEVDHGESGGRRVSSVLYSLNKLVPGKPFVVTWRTGEYRGVSFADRNNITRYFEISESWEKGAPPFLAEFVLRPVPSDKTENKCVVKVRSDDVLWIRAEPSASAAGVGSISPGACGVTVYPNTCKGSWCRVWYGNYIGWANTKLLK